MLTSVAICVIGLSVGCMWVVVHFLEKRIEQLEEIIQNPVLIRISTEDEYEK